MNETHRCSHCGAQWVGAHQCRSAFSPIETCIHMLSFNDNDLVREARAQLATLRSAVTLLHKMVLQSYDRSFACIWCGRHAPRKRTGEIKGPIAHTAECLASQAMRIVSATATIPPPAGQAGQEEK